jgi:hypothetical protein
MGRGALACAEEFCRTGLPSDPVLLRVSAVSFCFFDHARCWQSGDYGVFLCRWGSMNTLPLPWSPFLKDLHDSSPRVPIRPCCKQSPCINPPHFIPISAERSGRGLQPIKHKTQRNLRCAAVQIFITRGPQPPSAAIFLLSQLRTTCFWKSSGMLIIQINHKRLRGRRCMDAPRSSPA